MYKLREIKIELTSKCAMNCIHCSSDSTPTRREEISLDDCLRIIGEASELGVEKIAVSGGEPLLYKHIIAVIRDAKAKNMHTSIYTTGNVVGAIGLIENLRNLGVDRLIYSIFGATSDKHEFITRIRGSFESTVSSIQYASGLGIHCEIHFVPLRFNYRELDDIALLGKSRGAKSISVLRFVPQGRGSLHIEQALSRVENLELARSIKKLRSRNFIVRTGSPFNFLFLNNAPECNAAIDRLIVSPNLEVHPCDAFKQIGNSEITGSDRFSSLKTASLVEIWEKSPYLLAVRDYLNSPFVEPCSTCASLAKCCSGCLAQKAIANASLEKKPDPDCLVLSEG
ncbi:MAG: radical SAM protein [Candidatus Neomarinimicrobiota bacterium]